MLFEVPRYVQILLILCVSSTTICAILILFPKLLGGEINEERTVARWERRWASSSKISTAATRRRDFTSEQINNMSSLGKWLISPENDVQPPTIKRRDNPYLILIWNHGVLLERRHIRRFTGKKFSPWEKCTVSNCVLSYKSNDLDKADAVVFHLHLTTGVSELPRRSRSDQRWIFLTDESPRNTFLYRKQKLSDYNGLFNWSMTYRSDSDVPVPYGRTILESPANFSTDPILRRKSKLVAIMGSNCAGSNGRWHYVNELKTVLGSDLDIYGRCLGGNITACPGHFDTDCPSLNAYKFYLAFENSNCREYLTEKVFWHGYQKLTVPIIMGAPKTDCEQLLPPRSFLHVSDFASAETLGDFIRYLDRHDDKYLEYHEWRGRYRVINEHGYFGSASRHYCRVCEALHYNSPASKVYEDVELFWNKERDCSI